LFGENGKKKIRGRKKRTEGGEKKNEKMSKGKGYTLRKEKGEGERDVRARGAGGAFRGGFVVWEFSFRKGRKEEKGGAARGERACRMVWGEWGVRGMTKGERGKKHAGA